MHLLSENFLEFFSYNWGLISGSPSLFFLVQEFKPSSSGHSMSTTTGMLTWEYTDLGFWTLEDPLGACPGWHCLPLGGWLSSGRRPFAPTVVYNLQPSSVNSEMCHLSLRFFTSQAKKRSSTREGSSSVPSKPLDSISDQDSPIPLSTQRFLLCHCSASLLTSIPRNTLNISLNVSPAPVSIWLFQAPFSLVGSTEAALGLVSLTCLWVSHYMGVTDLICTHVSTCHSPALSFPTSSPSCRGLCCDLTLKGPLRASCFECSVPSFWKLLCSLWKHTQEVYPGWQK